MENFAQNRSGYMRQHIRNYFNLPNLAYTLFHVPSTGGGKIQINTVTPEVYPWGGYYYPNIPIKVTAVPDTGYVFSGCRSFLTLVSRL